MAVHDITVRYPGSPDLVLRTDLDWDRDVEPVAHEPGTWRFVIEHPRPFLYFKPVLRTSTGIRWARGENRLTLLSEPTTKVYPYFSDEADPCSVCDVHELVTEEGAPNVVYRVFTPPGYSENTEARYPVVYMADGQNLFFPEESFAGVHWRVGETTGLLAQMNALRSVLIVGVYPNDRTRDYTHPGYGPYGRRIATQLKPLIDTTFRTLPTPMHTAAMGASLGGVLAFHLGWTHPDVFGQVACLSSTFGYRDDLFARVATEPVPPTRFYLDSGWPRDNFEATREMRTRLLKRGLSAGNDMMYLAFPHARHTESAWSARLHIPFQFLFEARDLFTVPVDPPVSAER
jgi:predicted alpha/beta superfamily hydrolase